MDIFGAGAKAGECRLLAVDASDERRDKLLALADEYDLIHETLMRLQVEQLRFSGDDPIPQIAQDE